MRSFRSWKREFSYSVSKQLGYLKKEILKVFPYFFILPLMVGNFFFYYLYRFFGISINWIETFFYFNMWLLFFFYLWFLYSFTPYLKRLWRRKVVLAEGGLFINGEFVEFKEILRVDFFPYKLRNLKSDYPEDILILNLKNGKKYLLDSTLKGFQDLIFILKDKVYNIEVDGYS